MLCGGGCALHGCLYHWLCIKLCLSWPWRRRMHQCMLANVCILGVRGSLGWWLHSFLSLLLQMLSKKMSERLGCILMISVTALAVAILLDLADPVVLYVIMLCLTLIMGLNRVFWIESERRAGPRDGGR